MHRRSLIAGATIFPWLPDKIQFPIQRLSAELTVDNDVLVQILLEAHASDASAEKWRRSWIGRAFVERGEWYLDDSEPRKLPDDLAELPGDLHYHSYTWGEAGEEDAMLVGAYRHKHIGCIIRIKGDEQLEMIMLAEFFAARPEPDVWEIAWNPLQLHGFIPNTESLGIPVKSGNSAFWP